MSAELAATVVGPERARWSAAIRDMARRVGEQRRLCRQLDDVARVRLARLMTFRDEIKDLVAERDRLRNDHAELYTANGKLRRLVQRVTDLAACRIAAVTGAARDELAKLAAERDRLSAHRREMARRAVRGRQAFVDAHKMFGETMDRFGEAHDAQLRKMIEALGLAPERDHFGDAVAHAREMPVSNCLNGTSSWALRASSKRSRGVEDM
jgi:hypothetical protein